MPMPVSETTISTSDGDEVMKVLAPFENVTVLYGHIHRENVHEEGNAHAHAKAVLVGFSVTVPVQAGRPLLGTWQAVFFCEFDGPRNRKLTVTVVG